MSWNLVHGRARPPSLLSLPPLPSLDLPPRCPPNLSRAPWTRRGRRRRSERAVGSRYSFWSRVGRDRPAAAGSAMRADVVRLTTIDGGRMKDDIPFLRRFWGLISDQNLELEDLLPNTLHCAMLWSGPSLLSFRPPPSIGLSRCHSHIISRSPPAPSTRRAGEL